MLLRLNTEVMISRYTPLVWRHLLTPRLCCHLDSDTLAQLRQVKVTEAPLQLNRLSAAQRR